MDAGEGWAIFAIPPAELAAHPTDDAGHHELYLDVDGIEAAIRELERRGVEISRPIREERWGRLAAIRMPDGTLFSAPSTSFSPHLTGRLLAGPGEVQAVTRSAICWRLSAIGRAEAWPSVAV